MASVDTLAEGLQLLQELLFEDILEPDAARANWAEAEGRLALLHSTIRSRVLEAMPAALEAAGDDRTGWAHAVAVLLGRAAAPCFAAGHATDGDRLLSRAVELAREEPLRSQLEAGRREPGAFTQIEHALWLLGHGRHRQARRVLTSLAKATAEPALREAARRVSEGPRPIKSAPPLFRFNGIGMGLYGSRDARPDGSYVATYCFSVLWVPIVPLAAYRVRDAGGNAYQFHSRERLGRVARAWQALAAAAVVGGFAFVGVQAYRTSPSRLARIGQAEARRLEESGKPAEAMARYLATATQHPDTVAAKEAAEGVVRLAAASVKEPCRPEDMGVVSRVAAAFDRLPARARAGAPASYLTARLLRWSGQIGSETPAAVNAAVAVLDLAARIATGPDLKTVSMQRDALRAKLAEALARAGRPVDALAEYAALGTPDAVHAAHGVLAGLGDDDALWVEASPEVQWWIRQATAVPELRRSAAAFQARLDAATAATGAVAALLEQGKEDAVRVALGRRPGDQDLNRWLATAARDNGDAAGCVARLRALGPPGRLTADGQRLLGSCLADLGRIEEADDVLSSLVDQRLGRYQSARRLYVAASEEVQERMAERARRGEMPPEVRTAMQGAPDEKQQEVFQGWVAQTMSTDARLAALRDGYLRHRAVAPASLALGNVKLRRAAALPLPERRPYLEAAERAFLSIRDEAEGTPAFHLGLGQVLYRLGRLEEGEKEMQALLARPDPEIHLEVAEAYREMGLPQRTREIAEGVFASASDVEWKQRAALRRSLAGKDLDDIELWLRRCDQKVFYVKTRLLEMEGNRHIRDGDLSKADRAYAEVLRFYEAEAAHDATAANNAGLALTGRYRATGDLARLRAAAKSLETAARLDPQSAIVAGNLADTLHDLGLLTVIDRWVRTQDLLLDSSEAELLVWALLRGPARAEALSALRKDPALRQHMDATRQQQLLAPQNPETYRRQLRWLEWTRDPVGLRALAATLDSVRGLAASDEAEHRAWLSGARDVQGRSDAQKDLARSEQRLARVRKGGHGPTVAAANLLHADKLDTLAYFDPSVEAHAAAAAACRRAMQAWPGVAAEGALVRALLNVAARRAAGSSPALKAALDKDRRAYSIRNLLHRAASGPSGGEVLAALRRQPEMAEALELSRAAAARDPSMTDWLTARLAGDAGLEQSARRVFERDDLALSYGIQARLRPDSEDDQADLALFKANHPARAAR